MQGRSNRSAKDESSGERVDAEYYVLGGGHVGTFVAQHLQETGHTGSLVDEAHEPSEISGRQGYPANLPTLAEAGVADASAVIAATRHESRNLLIAQLVRSNFDVPRRVVLANSPDRLDVLTAAGHDPVCATTALSTELAECT